jgi:hypothetical protein
MRLALALVASLVATAPALVVACQNAPPSQPAVTPTVVTSTVASTSSAPPAASSSAVATAKTSAPSTSASTSATQPAAICAGAIARFTKNDADADAGGDVGLGLGSWGAIGHGTGSRDNGNDVDAGLGIGSIGDVGDDAGLGLGSLGDIGVHGGSTGSNGAFTGRGRETRARLREVGVNVDGRLPPEIVKRVVHGKAFSHLRDCYEGADAGARAPACIGFAWDIDRAGSTTGVRVIDSDGADPTLMSCTEGFVASLNFPSPERGSVHVTYGVVFLPPEKP